MAKKQQNSKQEIANFLGEMISFRNALKLTHWSITGKGSYEAHITDRLVETTFSLEGTLDIVIPQTSKPANYIKYIEDFYKQVENKREGLFKENFSQSIIDDAQEAVQQLLFRLKRLE